MQAGIFAFAPAVVRKTPKYRTPALLANPWKENVSNVIFVVIIKVIAYHNWESREANEGIEDKDGSSHSPFVSDPGRAIHQDTGKGIGRCHQALRGADRVTHVVPENNRQEVGDRVGDSRQAEENHGEAPDLEVQARSSPLLEAERLDACVISVLGDSANDELAFLFVQEVPGSSRGSIREVHQEEVSNNSDDACQDTFHDENPSPAAVASDAALSSVVLVYHPLGGQRQDCRRTICMSPNARIPEQADARHPMR